MTIWKCFFPPYYTLHGCTSYMQGTVEVPPPYMEPYGSSTGDLFKAILSQHSLINLQIDRNPSRFLQVVISAYYLQKSKLNYIIFSDITMPFSLLVFLFKIQSKSKIILLLLIIIFLFLSLIKWDKGEAVPVKVNLESSKEKSGAIWEKHILAQN